MLVESKIFPLICKATRTLNPLASADGHVLNPNGRGTGGAFNHQVSSYAINLVKHFQHITRNCNLLHRVNDLPILYP